MLDFVNKYSKGKAFPETAIGDILSGENDERIRQTKHEEETKKYIVESRDIKTNWNSIGGLKDAKKALQKNIAVIEPKRKNKNFSISPQHVLLYGPPGTGKTLLAQAAARHSGFSIDDEPGKYEKCTEWNTIMDGIEKRKFPGLTIVAATNKAEQIDMSLLRSGRFGIKLLIKKIWKKP